MTQTKEKELYTNIMKIALIQVRDNNYKDTDGIVATLMKNTGEMPDPKKFVTYVQKQERKSLKKLIFIIISCFILFTLIGIIGDNYWDSWSWPSYTFWSSWGYLVLAILAILVAVFIFCEQHFVHRRLRDAMIKACL